MSKKEIGPRRHNCTCSCSLERVDFVDTWELCHYIVALIEPFIYWGLHKIVYTMCFIIKLVLSIVTTSG